MLLAQRSSKTADHLPTRTFASPPPTQQESTIQIRVALRCQCRCRAECVVGQAPPSAHAHTNTHTHKITSLAASFYRIRIPHGVVPRCADEICPCASVKSDRPIHGGCCDVICRRLHLPLPACTAAYLPTRLRHDDHRFPAGGDGGSSSVVYIVERHWKVPAAAAAAAISRSVE